MQRERRPTLAARGSANQCQGTNFVWVAKRKLLSHHSPIGNADYADRGVFKLVKQLTGRAASKKLLGKLLRMIDADQTGNVSLDEFVRVLSMPAPGGAPMPPERAQKIFHKTDRDGVSSILHP